MRNGSSDSREIAACEVVYPVQEVNTPIAPRRQLRADSPWSYETKRLKRPFRLNGVEWRILRFLSSKPYRAFTPRRIAAAVTTDSHPVTEESLRGHITNLRKKLGLFADYVQTVPYIGYRFKE
jgi:DNA-binding response OmpR family regulator